MVDIIHLNEIVLNNLLELKNQEKFKNLTFWLRKKNNDNRLKSGQWFIGSHYIFVGLVKKGDSNNKTQQLGLVFNFKNNNTIDIYLEIVFKTEKNIRIINCYNEIINKLNCLGKNNKFSKKYEYITINKCINNFFNNDYMNIIQIIKQHNLNNELLIDSNSFENELIKIKEYRIDLLEKYEDDKLNNSIANLNLKNNLKSNFSRGPKEKKESKKNRNTQNQNRCITTAINALKRADFQCEMDNNHQTFIRKKDGKLYTEVHHLIPMKYYQQFKYSIDHEANIVSLCSNCHNKLHYGKDFEIILEKLYKERKNELLQAGIKISYNELKKLYL